MILEAIPASTRFRAVKLMTGAAAVYLVLRLMGFHKLFENDAEGVGVLLGVIGTLYSVVYAFATLCYLGTVCGGGG